MQEGPRSFLKNMFIKLLRLATIITPQKNVLPKTNWTILFTFGNEMFLTITWNKEEHGRIFSSKLLQCTTIISSKKKMYYLKPIKLPNMYLTHQTMQYMFGNPPN
jgi:hypothetical protein